MTTTMSPQDWLQQEWAAGRHPTGAQLAREFDLTARRGQQIVKAAKAAKTTSDGATAVGQETGKLVNRLDIERSALPPKPEAKQPPRYDRDPMPWGVTAHEFVHGTPKPNGTGKAKQAKAKRDWTRVWTIVAVSVVALAAAVISFAHQWRLATEADEAWRAWLLPVSVDGLIAAAALTVTRVTGTTRKWATWTLGAAIAASVAANIASAWPDPLAMIVASWAPIALFVAYELLVRQLREERP